MSFSSSLQPSGLLAIAAAAVNGARFAGTGSDGDSLGMAMTAGIALLSYVVTLLAVFSPACLLGHGRGA